MIPIFDLAFLSHFFASILRHINWVANSALMIFEKMDEKVEELKVYRK